jgi:hypothetical protein
MSRRYYPKHKYDPIDRFITERSTDEHGKFSFAKMVALFESLDCPPDFIPREGTNGSRRMTAGIQLRYWFVDNIIRFKDGSIVRLLEE